MHGGEVHAQGPHSIAFWGFMLWALSLCQTEWVHSGGSCFGHSVMVSHHWSVGRSYHFFLQFFDQQRLNHWQDFETEVLKGMTRQGSSGTLRNYYVVIIISIELRVKDNPCLEFYLKTIKSNVYAYIFFTKKELRLQNLLRVHSHFYFCIFHLFYLLNLQL